MEVKALAKAANISPRKAGLVASLVRGRSVDDALVILEHTPKKAALIFSKLINSAKANATNNHNLKDTGLTLSQLSVGPGPSLKRFRPVAFGRAHPYRKRTSNIRLVISGEAKVAEPKPAKVKTAKSKEKK